MSRIMQMPPPPPLLLTKRVTSFLRANLSPHIHSAMLTTPAGSLLAHASNLPASALRRQAAVAASLWALQGPAHTAPTSPGPASTAIPAGSTVRARKTGKHSPPTVTVQLDGGAVFVIRRLRNGMLFICMGGAESTPNTPGATSPHITRLSRSPAPKPSSDTPTTTPQAAQDDPNTPHNTTTTTTDHHQQPTPTIPPSTSPPTHNPPTITTTPATTTTTPTPPTAPNLTAPTPPTPAPTAPSATGAGATHIPTPPLGSPSESASILSSHTLGAASTTSTMTASGGSSVSLMRRQVEELARWLDERLGGLCVPEEGIGITASASGLGGGLAGNGNGGGGVEVR